MNKTLICLAAAALIVGSCAQDRSQILKVYNWSDYIDESVIPEFEQWYEAETGEKVQVIYQTFDINETMLSKIEKGHEDYDVVCPSDYIIERMLRSDLLLPLDRDFGDTPNYIDENLSPYIRDCFNKIEGNGKNANDYSVGYMWGTTGILYNAKYVTDEEALTWDIIRNPKFKGRIFIKDSARDVYSQIILKIHEEDIAAGRISADELMNYTSDEDIAAVEAYLSEAREYVAGWEADFGKDQMVQETGWVNLNWSGDSVWAIDEAAEQGVELRYALPREGFTVWFDGWVIPKYAQNIKAAKYWINFLSRPDIVVRNVDACGYVSVSGTPEVLEAFVDEECDPLDLTYFFGAGYDSVRVSSVLYPDKADIDRATQEHDWADNTVKLIEMWGRVKGDNASATTYIIIGIAVVAGIAAVVMANANKKRRKASRKKRRR
ncbi:MAG: ABC transporter substrate-binding protein [Bacteroidales bacterium]|nr:ABC transporter substrate-binding protein [Bacteroidales bacterium]